MKNVMLACAITACVFLGMAVFLLATSRMIPAGPDGFREYAEGSLDYAVRDYAASKKGK